MRKVLILSVLIFVSSTSLRAQEAIQVGTSAEFQAALTFASTAVSNVTIRVASGQYSISENLGKPFTFVYDRPINILIEGAGKSQTIISGETLNRVLAFVWAPPNEEDCPEITPTVTIRNLTVTLGRCTPELCDRYDPSDASTLACGLRQNDRLGEGSGGGAGIYAAGLNLVLDSVEIHDNQADDGFGGGAIALRTSISNSRLSSNEAVGGGALQIFHDVSVSESTFENNWARRTSSGVLGGDLFTHGGAIYCRGSDCSLTTRHSTFTNNVAAEAGRQIGFGGAVYLQEGENVKIYWSSFTGNQGAMGGAIMMRPENIHIIGSSFLDNTAFDSESRPLCDPDYRNFCSGGGGALNIDGWWYGPKVDIERSEFRRNSASGYGGAIVYLGVCFDRDGVESRCNTQFDGSQELAGKISISDSVFDSNYSSIRGGAIGATIGITRIGTYVLEPVHIENSRFSNNSSGGLGGAIFSQGRPVHSINSIFFRNESIEDSASVVSRGSVSFVNSALYADNSKLVLVQDFDDDLDNQESDFWNSILLGNTSELIYLLLGNSVLIRHSFIDPTLLGSNVSSNDSNIFSSSLGLPGLLEGSFMPEAGSDLIDSGIISAPRLSSRDILRNERIHGSTVDIGPYEFNSPPVDFLFANGFE